MVDLVVIALICAGIGAIVWGADRKHRNYGILLPAGVAIAAALLTWIITVSAGLGYQPGWTWVPWIASLIVGAAVSVLVVAVLGASRARFDSAHLTAILRR
jgi:quaternary ammonium compound-resistance protein SugE